MPDLTRHLDPIEFTGFWIPASAGMTEKLKKMAFYEFINFPS